MKPIGYIRMGICLQAAGIDFFLINGGLMTFLEALHFKAILARDDSSVGDPVKVDSLA